jgi:hypothetical protein
VVFIFETPGAFFFLFVPLERLAEAPERFELAIVLLTTELLAIKQCIKGQCLVARTKQSLYGKETGKLQPVLKTH